ncbi:MAG: DNA-binding protein [Candidatus Anstonellaceae archaeon]
MQGEDEAEAQDSRQKLYEKRMQQLQMEMQKKELLRRMLSEGAYERMMNVRIANPELYEKVISSLAYVAQSGKPMPKITDEQLRELLAKMTEKRETSIEFRHK